MNRACRNLTVWQAACSHFVCQSVPVCSWLLSLGLNGKTLNFPVCPNPDWPFRISKQFQDRPAVGSTIGMGVKPALPFTDLLCWGLAGHDGHRVTYTGFGMGMEHSHTVTVLVTVPSM